MNLTVRRETPRVFDGKSVQLHGAGNSTLRTRRRAQGERRTIHRRAGIAIAVSNYQEVMHRAEREERWFDPMGGLSVLRYRPSDRFCPRRRLCAPLILAPGTASVRKLFRDDKAATTQCCARARSLPAARALTACMVSFL